MKPMGSGCARALKREEANSARLSAASPAVTPIEEACSTLKTRRLGGRTGEAQEEARAAGGNASRGRMGTGGLGPVARALTEANQGKPL